MNLAVSLSFLEDLGWKSLKNRRKVERLCLLKKGLNKNATLPFDDLSIKIKAGQKNYNTCTTDSISQFMHAQTFFKFSFVPRTVKDWNSLLCSAVEIVEDAKFRNCLLSVYDSLGMS